MIDGQILTPFERVDNTRSRRCPPRRQGRSAAHPNRFVRGRVQWRIIRAIGLPTPATARMTPGADNRSARLRQSINCCRSGAELEIRISPLQRGVCKLSVPLAAKIVNRLDPVYWRVEYPRRTCPTDFVGEPSRLRRRLIASITSPPPIRS